MRSPIVKVATNNSNMARNLANGIALSPYHLGPSITTTLTDPTNYSTFGTGSSLIINYNTSSNNGRIWVNNSNQCYVPPNATVPGFDGIWRELFSSDNAVLTKSVAGTLTAASTNFAVGFNANTSLFPTGTLVNTGVSMLNIDANPYDGGFYFLVPYDGLYYVSATLGHSGLTTVNDFIIELWVDGAPYVGGISRFDSFGQAKIISVEAMLLLTANQKLQLVSSYTGPATLALATNATINRMYVKAFCQGIEI